MTITVKEYEERAWGYLLHLMRSPQNIPETVRKEIVSAIGDASEGGCTQEFDAMWMSETDYMDEYCLHEDNEPR